MALTSGPLHKGEWSSLAQKGSLLLCTVTELTWFAAALQKTCTRALEIVPRPSLHRATSLSLPCPCLPLPSTNKRETYRDRTEREGQREGEKERQRERATNKETTETLLKLKWLPGPPARNLQHPLDLANAPCLRSSVPQELLITARPYFQRHKKLVEHSLLDLLITHSNF